MRCLNVLKMVKQRDAPKYERNGAWKKCRRALWVSCGRKKGVSRVTPFVSNTEWLVISAVAVFEASRNVIYIVGLIVIKKGSLFWIRGEVQRDQSIPHFIWKTFPRLKSFTSLWHLYLWNRTDSPREAAPGCFLGSLPFWIPVFFGDTHWLSHVSSLSSQ